MDLFSEDFLKTLTGDSEPERVAPLLAFLAEGVIGRLTVTKALRPNLPEDKGRTTERLPPAPLVSLIAENSRHPTAINI